MELFQSSQKRDNEPLASRMRPKTLDEFAGQDHIVGKGRLLRRSIQADQLSSVIFYGPPGTGKTTLARVIAGTTKSLFLTLNAVLCGVKDIRIAIDEANENRNLYEKKTILFVDEVHRWNKAQQDALLPWVENGTFILIGATTENPYFEVNNALVSRSRIFQLKELDKTAMEKITRNALDNYVHGYGKWNISFEEGALNHLIKIASGDARTLLNALQLAVETTPETFPPPEGENIHISLKTTEESIQQKAVLYDKEGDYHFDTISAFIKSIRGSDPDAALYWMAKMLRAGEDPKFILRRLLISASEDIGLADPHALSVVNSAASAFDRVGMPEGAFHLSQVVLYLATAPKSNSAMAYFDAVKVVINEENNEVPNHLKDPGRDKHSFGHGEGYNYPHAYRDHWIVQAYLPEELKGRFFYKPSSVGYEKTIQLDVIKRREAQMAEMIEQAHDEVLTYSPGDKARDKWVRRAISGQGKLLQAIRENVFNLVNVKRHETILISGEKSGLFLWEAFRKAPEGLVCGLIPEKRDYDLTEHYSQTLPENERPYIYNKDLLLFNPSENNETSGVLFDCTVARDIIGTESDCTLIFSKLYSLLGNGGKFAVAELNRSGGTKLSSFIENDLDKNLFLKMKEVEDKIYNKYNRQNEIKEALKESSFSNCEIREILIREKRLIVPELLERWLSTDSENSYGSKLLKKTGSKNFINIKEKLSQKLNKMNVNWERSYLFISGEKK